MTLRRDGTPQPVLHPSTVRRFWAKTGQGAPNACWLWIATTNHAGYGIILDLTPPRRTRLAHRISWIIHEGLIPTGMFVCHHCDVPACVNPSHLFLGTARENMQDAIRKGRALRGQKNGHAKLTNEMVQAIRVEYLAEKVLQRDLAARYGVSQQCISRVLRRERWAWIK